MACPKKPFPKTSPWMRSQGLKMRWEQLLGDLKDSERPMSREINGWSLREFSPGDLHVLLLRLEKDNEHTYVLYKFFHECWSVYLESYLKDLLFNVPSSTTSVLSKTAPEGDDRRIRDVAGTPRGLRGDPSLSRSKCCRTGSYSMSNCSVWLVRCIRSST